MKCKVKIGTLMAFVFVLLGHAQNRPNDSITGRYVNDQNSAEYLDIKSDGSFAWRVGGRDFGGSYQVSGDVLTLRFPPVGATARGKLVGEQFNCCLSNGLGPAETKLIDDDSKNWVRRGAPSPASEQNSTSSQVADGHTAPECPAKFPNPVLPDACLGQFRHGTPVRKMGLGGAVDLAKATPATATNTHPGVDLVQLDKNGSPQCGGPIYPLTDGEVVDLISDHNDPDWKFLGYMVMVRHPSSGEIPTYTLYLHMQEPPSVQLHQHVHAGTGGSQLGKVGNTGAAAGCHTHFEIRHFPTRYLEECSWNFPSNIYGKGYVAKSAVFEENWENPEIVIANNNRLPAKSSSPREVVLADFLTADGSTYFLAPFLLYANGAYTTLPDGTASGATAPLVRQDYLPDGTIDPKSPRVTAARAQSILNKVRDFNLYEHGTREGCFSITEPVVAPVGAAGAAMVVGMGTLTGTRGNAIAGPARHEGFWSSVPLTPVQQKRLLSEALGSLPKTVPLIPKERLPQNSNISQMIGKPIGVGKMRTAVHALNLNLDNKREVFFFLDTELKTSVGPFASGYVALLEAYDPGTDSWKKMLSCMAIAEGGEILWGDSTCDLGDVLDINGDGIAEVILRRGHGEVGDIEVYEVGGGQMRLVSVLRGWTGS